MSGSANGLGAILSIDHGRHDLEPVARAAGADPARIPRFKTLVAEAAIVVAAGQPGYGMFLDGDLGGEAISHAAAAGLWIAQQYPHGRDDGISRSWPLDRTVKLIINARADARTPSAERMPEVERIARTCEREGRPVLVEALAGTGDTTAALVEQICARGISPRWWLVEPQATGDDWRRLADVVRRHGAVDVGVIVIARNENPRADFGVAAAEPLVRAFVGGRSIFGRPFKDWLAGRSDDEQARVDIAGRFRAMGAMWDAGKVRLHL